MSDADRNLTYFDESGWDWDSYSRFDDTVVSNTSNTVGIVDRSRDGWEDIDWQTYVSPDLMEDWLRLLRFCYPDKGGVKIGVVVPTDDDEGAQFPALVAGFPDEDRVISLAGRLSKKSPQEGDSDGE